MNTACSLVPNGQPIPINQPMLVGDYCKHEFRYYGSGIGSYYRYSHDHGEHIDRFVVDEQPLLDFLESLVIVTDESQEVVATLFSNVYTIPMNTSLFDH